jgi:hypothetical protein
MALHIADYYIVRDRIVLDDGQFETPPADFELGGAGEAEARLLDSKFFRFALPSHAAVGDTGILAYMLDPVPFGGEIDIEYEILLNEHSVQRLRIQSGMLRGLWGLVRGNWLWEVPAVDAVPRENNLLEFREIQTRSHGGILRFFNVVLWFQRAVAEP